MLSNNTVTKNGVPTLESMKAKHKAPWEDGAVEILESWNTQHGENFTDIKRTRQISSQCYYPFNATELINLFREHFEAVKCAFEVANNKQKIELHKNSENIFREHSEDIMIF